MRNSQVKSIINVFGYDVFRGISLEANEKATVQTILSIYISDLFEICSNGNILRSSYILKLKQNIQHISFPQLKLLCILNDYDSIVSHLINSQSLPPPPLLIAKKMVEKSETTKIFLNRWSTQSSSSLSSP